MPGRLRARAVNTLGLGPLGFLGWKVSKVTGKSMVGVVSFFFHEAVVNKKGWIKQTSDELSPELEETTSLDPQNQTSSYVLRPPSLPWVARSFGRDVGRPQGPDLRWLWPPTLHQSPLGTARGPVGGVNDSFLWMKHIDIVLDIVPIRIPGL